MSLLADQAFAGRDALTTARAELTRVHVRLVRAALADPTLLAARDAAGRACAELYQVRQDAIAQLVQSSDYADLRMALWGKQKQLEGLYVEIPARVQQIVGGARDVLSIRSKLTQMEMATLDANADYVAARDEANQKMAAYQQQQRAALEAIRTDPALAAASQRVRAMQRSITGFRGSAVAGTQ